MSTISGTEMHAKSRKSRKIKKRLASCLPIDGVVTDCLYNPDSKILFSLALPNTPLSKTLRGEENIRISTQSLIISSNHSSVRYMRLREGARGKAGSTAEQPQWAEGVGIAVLVVRTEVSGRHVLDDIYVEESYRRQGMASELLELAYRDFPDLCLDGHFSHLGRLFFGALHRTR